MKRIWLMIICSLFFTINHVQAIDYTSYFPGGKNYLDENNFALNGNTLSTVQGFKVDTDTFYTLSIPGTDMLGDNIVIDVSGVTSYLSGDVTQQPLCTVNTDETICTFKTELNETQLHVTISSEFMGLYKTTYGMIYFQLEEGEIATTYEAYVPPLYDSRDPEFNGAGAYVTSYLSNKSIQTIINEHIVVIDEIDGDLTDQIVIDVDSYTPNIGVVGEHNVTMHVSDSSGNTSYFTLTVIVKDEINPIITGPENIALEVFDTRTADELILEYFTLEDEYDGTLLHTITINEYQGMNGVLGTYNLSFSISDSSNNTVLHNLSIDVVDTTKPTFTGNTEYVSNLSNPLTIGEMINGLVFTDNYTDMSTRPVVIVYEDYTSNKDIPGIYEIGVQVKDTSNNYLNVTITVTVVDDIAPIITGPSEYVYSYQDVPTLNELKSLFTIEENVDQLSIADFITKSNSFSTRSSDIGEFSVTFQIADSSGNMTTHVLRIIGVDDVAPVIYIDSNIISIDLNSTFTQEDALRLLINNQEIPDDDYVIHTIRNEYIGNENKEGMYQYTLQFERANGEIYEKDFQINVNTEKSVDNPILRNVIVYSSLLVILSFMYIKKK